MEASEKKLEDANVIPGKNEDETAKPNEAKEKPIAETPALAPGI